MSRLISTGVLAAMMALTPMTAAGQAVGAVEKVAGELGDFVVMRDGVAYSLTAGDAVRVGDILRAKYPGSSITFNLSGEAGERDIVCEVQATEELTVTEAVQTVSEEEVVCMDVLAGSRTPPVVTAEATPPAATPEVTTTGAAGGGAGAPLIIGGIVVAAGGIAAAAGGGGDDGPTSP
ncbi:MAG: hypothetical protein AAFR51_05280 [Pseudomonadota bacterium]